MKSMDAEQGASPYRVWPAEPASFSTRRMSPLRHNIDEHPLFQLSALQALAHELMPTGQCRFQRPGATQGSAFVHEPKHPQGLSIDEVFARMEEPAGARSLAVPRPFAILTHITTFVLAVTVIVGVLTTASGPHSGDEDVVRTGVDASVLAHVHAWPGYALFALTLALLVGAAWLKLPTLRWTIVLLVVELVQIGVGLYQARNGLPPLAVGVHMVLAALSAAVMTVVVLRLKRPVTADRPVAASVGA